VVLNYACRGFKDSGGETTVAGPRDIADITEVIDHAVARCGADADRVGLWGLSYGAGMALLAAASEPRLKAVGSLEGFTDLVRTAYPNRTRSTVLMGGLLYGAVIAGKLSADTQAMFDVVLQGGDMTPWVRWFEQRSPIRVIDRINAHRPAIFMATAWNDLAYGTDQVHDFFEQITAPKRLELRAGDHVINEVPSSVGIGDTTMYDHLFDWMTTYVGGTDTAVVHEPAVWMQPRGSAGRPAPEKYSSWDDATTGERTYTLTAPSGFVPTGGLSTTAAATSWTATIEPGGDVAAGYGAPVAGFAGEALTGNPPNSSLFAINRSRAVFWEGDPLPAKLRLRGQQTVTFELTPSAANGTLVCYLYDSEGAIGHLISHRPYSWTGATPGRPFTVTLPLQPTAYDVPAGHRLAAAVTGGDLVYANENPDGARLGIGGPARLTVSVG
jgi:X-Pro dipeptidyl-peptidase-like protein